MKKVCVEGVGKVPNGSGRCYVSSKVYKRELGSSGGTLLSHISRPNGSRYLCTVRPKNLLADGEISFDATVLDDVQKSGAEKGNVRKRRNENDNGTENVRKLDFDTNYEDSEDELTCSEEVLVSFFKSKTTIRNASQVILLYDDENERRDVETMTGLQRERAVRAFLDLAVLKCGCVVRLNPLLKMPYWKLTVSPENQRSFFRVSPSTLITIRPLSSLSSSFSSASTVASPPSFSSPSSTSSPSRSSSSFSPSPSNTNKSRTGQENVENSGGENEKFQPSSSPKEELRRLIKAGSLVEAGEGYSKLYDWLVLPRFRWRLWERLGADRVSGILVSGSKGTGKSTLVKDVCRFASLPLTVVSCNLYSRANQPHLLQALNFAYCGENGNESEEEKAVLLDDLDAVSSRVVVTTLARLMDNAPKNLVTIATAAGNVDPLLRRPGRLEREISIPHPTSKQRLNIIDFPLA